MFIERFRRVREQAPAQPLLPPETVPETKNAQKPRSERRATVSSDELLNLYASPRYAERPRQSIPTTEDETILSSRERVSSELLQGKHGVYLVNFKDDGSGVYKPEATQITPEAGTGSKRERAAYLLDRFLGFNMVPPTVIRDAGEGEGSMQRFVADAATARQTDREEKMAFKVFPKEEKLRLDFLDYLLANTDRHEGNWLVKDQKIYAIDHGFAFEEHARWGYYAEDLLQYKGMEIPEDIRQSILELHTSDRMRELFMAVMSELLSTQGLDELFARIDLLRGHLEKSNLITKELLEAIYNSFKK